MKTKLSPKRNKRLLKIERNLYQPTVSICEKRFLHLFDLLEKKK